MKHGLRDAGTFVGSVLGSAVIGFVLFQLMKEPCPPIAGLDFGVGECVGTTTFDDWMKAAGALGTVGGFILACISELWPGNEPT
jgi:fluoride ion exporter CrcB/FEX